MIVKHQTKGRIRLKGKEFYSGKGIEKLLEKLDSKITGHRANNSCGSVIIFFDEKAIVANDIFGILDLEVEKKEEEGSFIHYSSCKPTECGRCAPAPVDKRSWRRKLIEFGILTGYAVFIFVKEHIVGIAVVATPFSLVAIVSLVAALPLFKEAYEDTFQKKKLSLHTFMTATLVLAIFGGEATAAFEIIYILRGGMLLEEYVTEKSRREIEGLIELDIQKVFIREGSVEIEVSIEEVKEGDVVVVRSGEKVPVDGIIEEGSAEINESLINGRSEAVYKTLSEQVFAGTIVEQGRVYISVSGVGKDTYISRILTSVENSLACKSPSELEADKLAAKLLKLGFLLTGGTLLLTGSFVSAFSVMIIMSCPCSTVLAASTAVSAGVANGAKDGTLIKGGEYLENVSRCDIYCFDKTGTLTTGKPEITDLIAHNTTEEELLYLSATAEYRNSHPLATAIIKYAGEKGYAPKSCPVSKTVPGYGIEADVEGSLIVIGNQNYMDRHSVDTSDLKDSANSLLKEGKTVMFVAKENTLIGLFAASHEVRSGIGNMINSLHKMGVGKIVLLTGDEKEVAESFASNFHFDAVYSNLLPREKADVIEKIGREGKVVMVGDGVNDTLAMSRADVSVSFATGGSEAAIEVSDIAITNSDPNNIVKLHELSKKTLQTVNQNYKIGTTTNLAGVSMATVGTLSPVAAGAIHIGHTLAIMANSYKIVHFNSNYQS